MRKKYHVVIRATDYPNYSWADRFIRSLEKYGTLPDSVCHLGTFLRTGRLSFEQSRAKYRKALTQAKYVCLVLRSPSAHRNFLRDLVEYERTMQRDPRTILLFDFGRLERCDKSSPFSPQRINAMLENLRGYYPDRVLHRTEALQSLEKILPQIVHA